MAVGQVRPYDETELVTRARNGDRDAFEELVRLHQNEVYTLAYRMVADRDLAYDVSQEAFIRAWRAIERFRGEARFSTWLYRITVNAAYTQRTRRKRSHAEPLETAAATPQADGVSPERAGESMAMRPAIQDAIAQLSNSLRAVVVLKDVYDWSHAEIAEHLGISLTATKVRLHRGRRALRETLWPYREGAE